MASYLVRKIGLLLLTMVVVSLVVFLALELNINDVAVHVLGPYSTADQRQSWLQEHGYFDPFILRYLRWLGAFFRGDWGYSTYYREDVNTLLPPFVANTAILTGVSLVVMIPVALALGVIAGMREGGFVDRLVSILAVLTTSVPQFASAVFLSAIFVFWLGLLPGASAMTEGFSWTELVMPVLVLCLAGVGYLARMTRASMVEVMAQPYIRTALMKGASTQRIVLKHALRNALIAPVTVIMLYIPWLLSNAIVVEVFFAYRGFGTLLYTASLNHDIYLIEACAMVSVIVVVCTQLLSDLASGWLNPRISFSGAAAAASA